MSRLLAGAVGLAIAGPAGALCAVVAAVVLRRVKGRTPRSPFRPVLLLVLVELRSGRSVLGALQEAARFFPDRDNLVRVARVAAVNGLASSMDFAEGDLSRLVSQLVRCQRSGSSVGEMVRSMLDANIAEERSRRLASARSLPVRLMVPMALLVLPGLVLMLYAPSLIRLWHDMSSPFT